MKIKKYSPVLLVLSFVSVVASASTDNYFFPGGNWVTDSVNIYCDGVLSKGSATFHVVPIAYKGIGYQLEVEFFEGTLTVTGIPSNCTLTDYSKGVPIEPSSSAWRPYGSSASPVLDLRILADNGQKTRLGVGYGNNYSISIDLPCYHRVQNGYYNSVNVFLSPPQSS